MCHHPPYYTILGYTTCSTTEYGANQKTKTERIAILLHLKNMEDEKLRKELLEQGTYYVARFNFDLCFLANFIQIFPNILTENN